MPPNEDRYADLPDHVKQEIDVRHGQTTDASAEAEPLTREQELAAAAYERHAMAERVLREARQTADNLLDEEARILAQIEVERAEAQAAAEIRDEASALVEEAKA